MICSHFSVDSILNVKCKRVTMKSQHSNQKVILVLGSLHASLPVTGFLLCTAAYPPEKKWATKLHIFFKDKFYCTQVI